MTFAIDKGIPIPQIKRGSAPKYPFAQMENGDSFLVVTKKEGLNKARAGINGAARNASVRIATRFYADTNHLRVWKIDTLTKETT